MSDITLYVILYIISLMILTAFARHTHINDGGSDWIAMAIFAFIPVVNFVFAGLLVMVLGIIVIFMLLAKLNEYFKQLGYAYNKIDKLLSFIYGTHKG